MKGVPNFLRSIRICKENFSQFSRTYLIYLNGLRAKVRKNNYTYSGRAQKIGYPLHSTLQKRRYFAQILLEIEIFEYKILQQIWFFRIFSISVRNCAKSRRFCRVEWRGYPTFRALPEYVKKIFLIFSRTNLIYLNALNSARLFPNLGTYLSRPFTLILAILGLTWGPNFGSRTPKVLHQSNCDSCHIWHVTAVTCQSKAP